MEKNIFSDSSSKFNNNNSFVDLNGEEFINQDNLVDDTLLQHMDLKDKFYRANMLGGFFEETDNSSIEYSNTLLGGDNKNDDTDTTSKSESNDKKDSKKLSKDKSIKETILENTNLNDDDVDDLLKIIEKDMGMNRFFNTDSGNDTGSSGNDTGSSGTDTGSSGTDTGSSDNESSSNNNSDTSDSNSNNNLDDNKSEMSYNSDEFSEGELEFISDDDEIREEGTFTKVVQVPVPELDKVFKESIQKGHLFKYKMENVPKALRSNNYFINKIQKEVNIISLLKSKVTKENKSISFKSNNFKPLVEKYLNHDFSNKFLIPLVLQKKRINLTKKDNSIKGDFNTKNTKIIDNFYQQLYNENEEYNKQNNKKLINYDTETNKLLNKYFYNDFYDNSLGLLFRLGDGIKYKNKLNKDSTFKLKTQKAEESNLLLSQETETIIYGQDEYKINNYSPQDLEFDAQVSLGSVGRYVSNKEIVKTFEELEEMDEYVDKDIINNNFITSNYYKGEDLILCGFVRPPIKDFLSDQKDLSKTNIIEEMNINESKNVKIIELNKLVNNSSNNDNYESEHNGLEYPNKYVVYVFPGLKNNTKMDKNYKISPKKLEEYLEEIIPSLNDIVNLYNNEFKLDNDNDMEKLLKVMYSFDYYYQSNDMDNISNFFNESSGRTIFNTKKEMTYNDYIDLKEFENKIVDSMVKFNEKLTKMMKLKKYKKKKLQEKKQIFNPKKENKQCTVITDDIVEQMDKVYMESFSR